MRTRLPWSMRGQRVLVIRWPCDVTSAETSISWSVTTLDVGAVIESIAPAQVILPRSIPTIRAAVTSLITSDLTIDADLTQTNDVLSGNPALTPPSRVTFYPSNWIQTFSAKNHIVGNWHTELRWLLWHSVHQKITAWIKSRAGGVRVAATTTSGNSK